MIPGRFRLSIGTAVFFLAAGMLFGVMVARGAPIYSDVVLGENPVAYWRLNETGGTTAIDERASFPGTYEVSAGGTPIALADPGPRPADGFLGLEATNFGPTFPGGNNGTNIATQVSGFHYGGDYPFTVEAWFRTTERVEAQNILTLSNEDSGNLLWGLGLKDQEVGDGSGSTVRAYAYNGSFFDVRTTEGGTGSSGGTMKDFDDGQWHYAAGVFSHDTTNEDGDGSTDYKIALYVDPTTTLPVATGFHSRSFSSTVNGTNIGSLVRHGGDIQSEFDGQIDEAAVYDYALTGEQVLSHYRAATTPEPSAVLLLALGLIGLLSLRPR